MDDWLNGFSRAAGLPAAPTVAQWLDRVSKSKSHEASPRDLWAIAGTAFAGLQRCHHDSISLGNIGLKWLLPACVLIACALWLFHLLHVRPLHQLTFFGVTLAWSFLMFSYLHDVQHIEGFWMARNRFLKRWFMSARHLHEIHHCMINDRGLMNKNFGIAFFFFDRLFGTFFNRETSFNHAGYLVARQRFHATLSRYRSPSRHASAHN